MEGFLWLITGEYPNMKKLSVALVIIALSIANLYLVLVIKDIRKTVSESATIIANTQTALVITGNYLNEKSGGVFEKYVTEAQK